LRYRACYRDDGSFLDFFFLQYEEPSLAPVLRATLQKGDTFFEVGANIGIYATWGARIVGNEGRVYAFEPVPDTARHLIDLVDLNALHNVILVPHAVSAKPGKLTLRILPHASGLSSAVESFDGEATESITVEAVAIDSFIATAGATRPQLLMIDVEGWEFEVICGAHGLLTGSSPPAVLFESHETRFLSAGTSFVEVHRWFEREAGYRLYGLTPRGLELLTSGATKPGSANTLALRPGEHAAILERLRHHRFRRNQSC